MFVLGAEERCIANIIAIRPKNSHYCYYNSRGGGMKESWKWIQETKHIWRIYDNKKYGGELLCVAELIYEHKGTYTAKLYINDTGYWDRKVFFDIPSIQKAQEEAQRWIIDRCNKMISDYTRITDNIKEVE